MGLYFDLQEWMEREENTPNYIKQLPWYAQDSKGGGQLIKIPTNQPKGYLPDWYNRVHIEEGHARTVELWVIAERIAQNGPGKSGARFSNKKIASDDVTKDVGDTYEAKKDRWNGYTSEMYKEVIADFNEVEEVHKKVKGDDIEEAGRRDDNPLQAANLPTRDYKEKFQGLNTGRNRQDRAKYLNDLSLTSAQFDPKSRVLQGQDSYLKQLSNLEAVGEKAALQEQDNFAYEHVQKHHMELNSTALPTLTQKIYRNVQNKKTGLTSGRMGEIMRKYDINKNQSIPEVEQNEQEIVDNYMRGNKVIRSRYEEDVIINDHLSVWGSWYNKYLGWGYSCCHSTQKLSYCSGLKGRERALAKEFKLKTGETKRVQQMKKLEDELEREEKEEAEQKEREQREEKEEKEKQDKEEKEGEQEEKEGEQEELNE